MLLIEEKEIPVQIELVPMRSYGDKPREFMQKVPNGLLPAMQVNGRIITESQVIMELLDQWHTVDDGYKPMLPDESDAKAWDKYNTLARLEREYVRNFVWPVFLRLDSQQDWGDLFLWLKFVSHRSCSQQFVSHETTYLLLYSYFQTVQLVVHSGFSSRRSWS